MKEVLIIFIILLVLLLMLSVLGGSIRLKSDEHFDDDIPLYDETLLPSSMKPWESHPSFIPQYKSVSHVEERRADKKSGKNEKREEREERKNKESEEVVEVVEEVVEEAMEDAFDEYEQIPLQETETEAPSLYMSDPYEYEKNTSMEEVMPYSRMSDFAKLES